MVSVKEVRAAFWSKVGRMTMVLAGVGGCTPHGPESDAGDLEEATRAMVVAGTPADATDRRTEGATRDMGQTPALEGDAVGSGEATDTQDARAGRRERTPEELEACAAGTRDAARDFTNDTLMLEVYGEPADCRKAYGRLLQERHGIGLRRVAGCRVTQQIVEHARCYNEVAKVAIDRMYGPGTFAKVAEHAGCD
jgi:hypothetical protein